MEFFSDSFYEARGKFLQASADVGAQITSYPLDGIQGETDELLATDVASLGPETCERAAIVVSGAHGSEGFCGSAIQTGWLAQERHDLDVKVVLVHAINPWAFSHRTRSNENNVDINRNFITDSVGYSQKNAAYDSLAHLLHSDPSSTGRTLELYQEYKAYFDKHGWHLENEIWQGQWHRPDGFMYGGTAPAWSNLTFRGILHDHLAGAKSVGFIDWHTGVGKFGEIVHLIFDDPNSIEYRLAAQWWGLKSSGDAAFNAGTKPKYRGLLCQAIRQELPEAQIVGAVIEFGTADNYSLFRGDLIDRWLRFEGREHPDRQALRAVYQDTFCPRDNSWRRLVDNNGPVLMDQLIRGVGALG